MFPRLAPLAGALLVLAACSNTPPQTAGAPPFPGGMGPGGTSGAPSYGPGSQQDLAAKAVVNPLLNPAGGNRSLPVSHGEHRISKKIE